MEAMEEVMQLWWGQRAQLLNVKFERLQIERESGARLTNLDAVLNKTEELIEHVYCLECYNLGDFCLHLQLICRDICLTKRISAR
jgi:hypothetical protein